jgi:hypothetical protein
VAAPVRPLRLEWIAAQPNPESLAETRASLAAQGHTLVEPADDGAGAGVDGCVWAPSKADTADGGRLVLALYARRALMPIFALGKPPFDASGLADDVYDGVDALCAGLARRRVFATEMRGDASGRLVFFWGEGDHRVYDLPEQIRSHGLQAVFVSPSAITICAPQRAGLLRGGALVRLERGGHASSVRLALSAEVNQARACFVMLSERLAAQPPDGVELLAQTSSARVVFVQAPASEGEAEEEAPILAPPAGLARPGMRTIQRSTLRDRRFLALLKTETDLD